MMELFKKKKNFYDRNDRRRELTEEQKELIAWFDTPLISKRGCLASCTWWTSRGKITPDMLLPVEACDSEYLYAELKEHMQRADTIKALKIAKLLLAFHEKSLRGDKWMLQARELLRKSRSGEYLWKPSPATGRDILYLRYRPGWEDVTQAKMEKSQAAYGRTAA